MIPRYVKIYIYCSEPNSKLIDFLSTFKSAVEKTDCDVEVTIHAKYDSFKWKENPLIAEISMASSPQGILEWVNIIGGVYDKYTGEMKANSAFYAVEILNNVFSNKKGCKYFSPELKRLAGVSVKDLFTPLRNKNADGDISRCKILEVETVAYACELGQKLESEIERKNPWSPIEKDGVSDAYLHSLPGENPGVLFKSLIDLREKTNVNYTNAYIQKLSGIKAEDLGFITCQDAFGKTIALDACKIANISPHSNLQEVPQVKVWFYDEKQMANGAKILDPIQIIVETTSFFNALLGINDFPPMPIHRVIPELLDNNLPQFLKIENDSRIDDILYGIYKDKLKSASDCNEEDFRLEDMFDDEE